VVSHILRQQRGESELLAVPREADLVGVERVAAETEDALVLVCPAFVDG
jgi:hypothetical protein